MLVVNCIIFLGMSYAYKIKLHKVILSIGIFIILSMSFEMLVSLTIAAINGITVNMLQLNVEMYFIAVVISKFALFLTIKLLLVFVKPIGKTSIDKYKFLHFIIPISSFLVLLVLSYLVYNSKELISRLLVVIASVVLVSANIVTFIIYDLSAKRENELHEKNCRLITLENQKESYESLISNQIQSNKTVHDLKNKMFLINEYMQKSDPKAIELVADMCDVISKAQIVKYTNISSVDVLINAKISEMKSKGITGSCNAILNGQITIDSMDLCVIIGNILDNAIEACEKVDKVKRTVELSINTKANYLAIKSTNPTVTQKVTKTTKSDKLLHGYGLGNIKAIVDKYDGSMNFGVEKEIFVIALMLNVDDFHPENG